ncbi:YqhV family protein [Paenibacillus turpanensis]|uniref:YqhV family protein n=1 Tax=Paenibacillus turpanensis TaxID=2689078 RepID=UPI00140BE400|nr:YqhV family protein [Paenibacillus turpanensis]
MVNKIVMTMAMLRVFSGLVELTAALLMLRFNSVEKALLVNSSLALVGPLVMLTVTTVGLVGVADKFSFGKLAWILAGVALIFIGILKK